MTEEEYNEKFNTMDKCVEYWMKKAKKLENENNILKNENKILKEGKTNVFAELNDETARSNAELLDKVAELEEEIKKIGKSAGFLCNQELKQQIKEAKEIIKNLLIIHNDTFGNTDLEWRCNVIAEAENF